MGFIRNILALIGLIFVAGLIYLGVQAGGVPSFDSKAGAVYWNMTKTLFATGNGAEATIWKREVAEGLTPEDVEDSMRAIANEHNFKNVGELPLYQQVEAMTGESYRYLQLFMYCDPLTAVKMVEYSEAFSAYLPCRISLIEDPEGKLWLYTLNMDIMIHGGEQLPPELKEEAIRVKNIILDIMDRAAEGDF